MEKSTHLSPALLLVGLALFIVVGVWFASAWLNGQKTPSPFQTGVVSLQATVQPIYESTWIVDDSTPIPTFDYKEGPPPPPTPEPIIEPETIPLEFPPVNAVPPSGNYKAYIEPVVGFSFEYPDNWNLTESPAPDAREGKGFVITIQNYDNVDQKGDKTIEQLKIEFAITARDQFSSLEEWIDSQRKPIQQAQEASDPGYSLTSIESTEIAGIHVARWTLTTPMIPQGAVVVGFMKDGRMYVLWAYPATSRYIGSLDEIVSSIKFP